MNLFIKVANFFVVLSVKPSVHWNFCENVELVWHFHWGLEGCLGLPNRHLLELPMDNLEFRISMEQRIEIIIIRMLEEERRT